MAVSGTAHRGRYGEELAARHLEAQGFLILSRNYRTRYGELDIVAKRCELVVFAEVKLRRNSRFADAGASVGRSKQEKLRKTALLWMMQFGEPHSARFDVFEVYTESDGQYSLNHIENAF